MRKVRLDDLDSRMGPAARSLPLTDALGLADAAMNFYELEPGDSFAYGFHAHAEQEEVFYVLDGRLSVETPDRVFTVEPGQFFVAEPGSPHRAHNAAEADRALRVIGMGAPPQSDGHSYGES